MENNENPAFQDALDQNELDDAANFSELKEENEELSPADEKELSDGNLIPNQADYTGYDDATAIEPEDLDTLNAQDEDDQDTMS